MQLSKLYITNFRSFGEKTSIDMDKLSAFIGANSSGKTSVIHALLKLFGTSQKDRILERSDFHIKPGVTPETIKEMELSIECRIDFPELSEAESEQGKSTIPPFINQLVIEEPGGLPYLRVRLNGKWVAGSSPDGEIEQNMYFVKVAEGEEESEGALIRVTPHQRSLIQVVYVPAVREPSTQLRNASGTILWRILKKINLPSDIVTANS